MKKSRLIRVITVFLLFTLLFVVQKPLFMLYYHSLYSSVGTRAWLDVIRHGLPLDLSMAGYLTVIPALLAIVSLWLNGKVMAVICKIYAALAAFFISLVFVLDLALYDYWGFRLDSTPFFYFMTSPADAVASVSLWVVMLGVISLSVCTCLVYILLSRAINFRQTCGSNRERWNSCATLILMTALLFLPIRGGLTVSTMNLGKVFFSSDQRLNHAAINPCFSLIDSFARQTNFDKQYRFMDDKKASAIFDGMVERPVPADSIPQLLTSKRPNIIIVIMEGFSSYLMKSLGGEPDVAVCIDSIASEGVLFTNFYANSFRTDRGLVAILSGYPAQPTTSIMKYARKTQSLPSIPGSLKSAGYHPYYYYGGDADFTNMRSYLLSMGMERIVSDVDFPVSQRLSKWGAHDDVVFTRLSADLRAGKMEQPFVTVMQTSSSHEPFEVPYNRLKDERLNAFAYADSCIGHFVREIENSPLWDNTLVVLVPDHLGAYPKDIDNSSPSRYKIPLIFTGGVIRQPQRISVRGSQVDLAATLLAQLGIGSDDFTFSKNILNSRSPHFAFFTFPNLFGYIGEEGEAVFNCETSSVVREYTTADDGALDKGKAYLQKLYDDIAKR